MFIIGILLDIKVNPHVTPVVQPYRRAPIHLEERLEKKLDELERMKIIERVNEPSRWVSALVPVLKANGDVRPCVNMRPANKAIVRENHPLPTTEQIWPQLVGATVFSTLDIKEALAIVWAVERFHHLLAGCSFTILTDHKPLVCIFKPESKPCARIERWVLRLQPYEFTVVYRKGKENIADPLSRLSAVDDQPETFDEDSEHYVNAVMESNAVKAVSLERIREENERDLEFESLRKAVVEGSWAPETTKWKALVGEFSVEKGILCRSNRIFIPKSLRAEVLKAAHEGHPGTEKMIKRLREKVWWPALTTDTTNQAKAKENWMKKSARKTRERKTR